MRKRILCFGDSNTWGYNPVTGSRYDEHTRWPGVLQDLLGNEYCVIEEGQNGRTFACDDPWEGGTKNGMKYLLPMLESQKPLDYLIIMLGTNDLKTKFSLPSGEIAGGLGCMVEQAKKEFHFSNKMTKIIVVAPITVGDSIDQSYFHHFFDRDAVERSKELPVWYKQIAEHYGCLFLDASLVASPGEYDAIHMMPEGHKALADAVSSMIMNDRADTGVSNCN